MLVELSVQPDVGFVLSCFVVALPCGSWNGECPVCGPPVVNLRKKHTTRF